MQKNIIYDIIFDKYFLRVISMKLYYNKELYPKAAVFKAAYNYTDNYYIYIDLNDRNYIIDITAKEMGCNSQIKELFDNEMLVQTARIHILQQTKNIRKLILARAFASTVIDSVSDSDANDDELEPHDEINIDNILTDWFENNE